MILQPSNRNYLFINFTITIAYHLHIKLQITIKKMHGNTYFFKNNKLKKINKEIAKKLTKKLQRNYKEITKKLQRNYNKNRYIAVIYQQTANSPYI